MELTLCGTQRDAWEQASSCTLPASREGQDTERVQHERPHLGRAQLPLEGNNRNVSEKQANHSVVSQGVFV